MIEAYEQRDDNLQNHIFILTFQFVLKQQVDWCFGLFETGGLISLYIGLLDDILQVSAESVNISLCVGCKKGICNDAAKELCVLSQFTTCICSIRAEWPVHQDQIPLTYKQQHVQVYLQQY